MAQGPREALRGLKLGEALGLAERRHPDLARGGALVEAAGGRVDQAGLLPNPRAMARMESAPFDGGTTGEAEYLVGISQALPVGGRLSAGSRAEELNRVRLLRELEARRLEVRNRVQGAFATALYMEEVIRAREEAARIAENGAAISRTLLDAGDALPEELARAEMELVRERLELERARSLRTRALASLKAAMGDPTLEVESVEGALDAALEIPTLQSLSSKLEENPFLASAQAEVAVQQARVALVERERIPDVNLDLFYRRLGDVERNTFDVGIGIAVPVFDRNQGRLREARAEVAAADARVVSTRNDLERRLRESHAVLVQALAAVRVLREEILPRARAVLQGAEARYAAGEARLLEILPLRRDRITVEFDYLESLRQVMEAWADLSPYIPPGGGS